MADDGRSRQHEESRRATESDETRAEEAITYDRAYRLRVYRYALARLEQERAAGMSRTLAPWTVAGHARGKFALSTVEWALLVRSLLSVATDD